MMRIISGKYKGKKLEGFDIEGTRPTQNRVKESLFAMIQNEIDEAIILDLFAGSGNLGIEALSNGAKFGYFVDNNQKCIQVLKRNLESISEQNAQILELDYQKALDYFSNQKIKFDIIFLDPPYSLKCFHEIIQTILKLNLLNNEGIIICEYEFEQFEEYPCLKLEKVRKYGYKNIKIYRKINREID